MKRLMLVLICALMIVMPVKATELHVNIPDVTGMTEADAVQALEALVLPDGAAVEIIKSYAYSSEVAADVVYAQEPVGEVAAVGQVQISISMGEEPEEQLSQVQEVSPLSTFGLAAYMANASGATPSQFGIDWDSLPCSYEYNWDNSENCWVNGVWIDGVCYMTPEGTYNTDVRNKVQLYCDGTYVYLHIVFAREYGSKVNCDAYNFIIDGNQATFCVRFPDTKEVVTGNISHLGAGTYQMVALHSNGAVSTQEVNGALAYLTKKESNVNAEVELRIPLSEMQYQNSSIDLDNIGTIQFQCSNVTGDVAVTASGASITPAASAVAALLIIPGSTILLNKYGKKKKDSNGQNV